jgi:hypothetical protein
MASLRDFSLIVGTACTEGRVYGLRSVLSRLVSKSVWFL